MKELPYATILPLVFLVSAVVLQTVTAAAADEGKVKGTFTVNDQTVDLKYGYLHRDDDRYIVSLTDAPVQYRKIDRLWTRSDISYVQLKFQADGTHLGHDLRHHARNGAISGSGVQRVELTDSGGDCFSGRAYIAEPVAFFDDTYQYDVTFKVCIPDPSQLGGSELPADGGEPGAAYLAFSAAILEGDIDKLKSLMPPEMAVELDGDEAAEMLEMMQMMTPKDAKVSGGMLYEETEAVLQVTGTMDGEEHSGEITMNKNGEYWVQSDATWK